jgi:hypothetical protein
MTGMIAGTTTEIVDRDDATIVGTMIGARTAGGVGRTIKTYFVGEPIGYPTVEL